MVKLKKKNYEKNTSLKVSKNESHQYRLSNKLSNKSEKASTYEKHNPFSVFIKENPNCTFIDNGDGTYDFIDG